MIVEQFEQKRLDAAASQICGAAPNWEGTVWILQDGIPRILIISFILLSLIPLFFWLFWNFKEFESIKERAGITLFSIPIWILSNVFIFLLACTFTSFGSNAYLSKKEAYRSCPAKVMNKWDKSKTIEENVKKIRPEILGEIK